MRLIPLLSAAALVAAMTALLPAAQALTVNHANEKEAKTQMEAVHKVCDGCHNTQLVMDTPKDYDEWHATMEAMIDRGARGTPAEFDLVMQYIYENMTTVNVNTGIPDDLKVVLGATDDQVSQIMARRATQPFKDLDDLVKSVPGLDAEALEAKKRMIYFQTL